MYIAYTIFSTSFILHYKHTRKKIHTWIFFHKKKED